MTESERPEPHPKQSETDPPAADRPVDDGGSAPPPPDNDPNASPGQQANDPSLTHDDVVPEVMQVPPGKPDGEVDTAFRRKDPPVERRL
jgi:hypothetical protein